MPKIDVCFTPATYHVHRDPEAIVVVIDVLRATTAICTAFKHGVDRMIPVAEIEEARALQKQGYLTGAERNGEKIEGFDFGNSPYDYMSENIKGKTVVLTTTNGTQAMKVAGDAYKLVIGAFSNLSVLCNWLIEQDRNVVLLCSGWKNNFNLEDSMFAGAVVEKLCGNERFAETTDAALSSKYLYQMARDDPFRFLSNSSHRKRLHSLKLKEDIRYSLAIDQANVIPIMEEGLLRDLLRE